MDRESREFPRERGGRGDQKFPGDVDRDVAGRGDRFDEHRRLGRRPGAEFDDAATWTDDRSDFVGVGAQQRLLRPRGIVFCERRDPFEEFGAAAVVEPTRRNLARTTRQAPDDVELQSGVMRGNLHATGFAAH